MNDATLITDGIGTRPAVRLERRLRALPPSYGGRSPNASSSVRGSRATWSWRAADGRQAPLKPTYEEQHVKGAGI